MKKSSGLCTLSTVLVVIGGLNWGLVAINRQWDLVNWLAVDLLGQQWLATLIYGLVGLAALVVLGGLFSKKEM